MNTASFQQKEKTAQYLWTGFILMFFLIQAIIWTTAIAITSQDSSHAVAAGYDEQALNWDEVKRQRVASEQLGWNAEIEVAPTGDIRGNRSVTVSLKDRTKAPIENAVVNLTAFHRGRAAEVQQVSLTSVEPGVFSATIKIQNSGVWRLSGTAIVDDQQFLFEQQLDIDSNRNL
jgi:nitrogen fixation protein FixH